MAARVPLDLGEVLRPIEVVEYHRMIEAGILRAEERVELIEGMIVTMPRCAPAHALAIEVLNRALVRAAADDLRVRPQLPLTVAPRSEPEPDLAVVRGGYGDRHPQTALLVIEVAGTSARIDRGAKLAVYARAAIPEYWIVDVARREVEVLREPDAAAAEYRVRTTLRDADLLRTDAVPALALAVGELFQL